MFASFSDDQNPPIFTLRSVIENNKMLLVFQNPVSSYVQQVSNKMLLVRTMLLGPYIHSSSSAYKVTIFP